MNTHEGVNYKPLRLDFRRGQDALAELSMTHKKMLPKYETQQVWIREALAKAFEVYASHPDFSVSKFELGLAMEDVLYDSLEKHLLRR
jgi:hypothetical protein